MNPSRRACMDVLKLIECSIEFDRFMYIGEVVLTAANIKDVMYAAEKYEVSPLVTKCNFSMTTSTNRTYAGVFSRASMVTS